MKKQTQCYTTAVSVAMLPLLRFLDEHFHILFVLLSIGVCLFFLIRGLYFQLLDSESGRAFLRRFPFLKVPEEREL